MLHTGGTLGMDPAASYEHGGKGVALRRGTGGVYAGAQRHVMQAVLLKHTSLVRVMACLLGMSARSLGAHESKHICSSQALLYRP